jgi:dihydrofolate synthase/folylpolyglutamate synthase
MPVASLAAVAREVFGEDRVLVRDRLDDAIEAAVGLADESEGDEDLPGSAAVLITGSVVTAGDARRLLVPGGPPDAAPPEPETPARHSFTAGDLS